MIFVLISALISAIVALIVALITIQSEIKKLKMQLRATYRSELAKRQIDACESFWALFGPASLTKGEHRIIRYVDDVPFLDALEAKKFVENFQETFCSKSGMYLSKDTRDKLHHFRDMLIEISERPTDQPEKVKLSNEDVSKFNKLRTTARLSLRDESGSKDLTVARNEYLQYEE